MSDIVAKMCDSLRLIWQKDLGCEIREDLRQDLSWNWATRDARSKFIQCKVTHRYYYTPLKLFKMGLLQNNKCWTLLHALWDCPKVVPLWKVEVRNLKGWLRHALPESPQLCLSGDKSLVLPDLTEAEVGETGTGFIDVARFILRPHRPELERPKLMTETAAEYGKERVLG